MIPLGLPTSGRPVDYQSGNGHHISSQFNILNSYFGLNSIYKNWPELPTNTPNRDLPQTQGFNVWPKVPFRSVGYDFNYPIYWNGDWPTVEDSFSERPKAAQIGAYNWCTSFWNNLNSGSHGFETIDENNNSLKLRTDPPKEQTFAELSPGTDDQFGSGWKKSYPLSGFGQTLANDETKAFSPFREQQTSDDGKQMKTDEGSMGLISSKPSHVYWPQTKYRRRPPTQTECVFCKNNNERPEFYRGHILKDPESKIQCPVLRAYSCPICHNGGGDKAHTIRYCPLNKAGLQAKIERLLREANEEVVDDEVDNTHADRVETVCYLPTAKKCESKKRRKSRKLTKSQ